MPKKVEQRKRRYVRLLVLISPEDESKINKYTKANRIGKSEFGRKVMMAEVEAWENNQN